MNFPLSRDNLRLGITLMIVATIIFAVQDGISRYLGGKYEILTVVMFRYWFFAAFVLAFSAAREGGIARVARTQQPVLQICRGVLLAAQICIAVVAFVRLGLVGTHTIFAATPLLVAALAGPVLGEYVGWRRGIAIVVGLVGVLVILRPGLGVMNPNSLIAVLGTFGFAAYVLMTRMVSRYDSSETTFFYTGVSGAVATTLVAPFFWDPMQGAVDWGWMLVLCITSSIGHYLLIRSYELADPGTLQPFTYFQLLVACIIGVTIFGETFDRWTVIGGGLILGAGLYAMIRQARLGGGTT